MSGTFTIESDPVRGLLRVRMAGFFTREDVRGYHAAVVRASRELTQPPAEQLMICDISAMMIQSQEIVAEFHQVMSDPRYLGRRVGFIAASSLARSQLSRIIGGRTARIFASAAEAYAWLLTPPAADAA